MDSAVRGYSLDFIHSMISEEGGRTSGWINNLELRSIFQPAFSLAHRCAIGFEASLRSLDDAGRSISPHALFGPVENFAETSMLDLLCATLHVRNFADGAQSSGLLLINLHPEVMFDAENTAPYLASLFRHYRVAPSRVMIDVPGVILKRPGLGDAISAYRQLGCLIAVDDFGMANTDLDSLWHVNPAVVKIDRTMTARAAEDAQLRQTLQRAVSLLHEMGVLVFMEGLEQESELMIALDSDADFGSGFHLGPMHDSISSFRESPSLLDDMWKKHFNQAVSSDPAEAAARSTLENAALRSTNIRNFRHASPQEIGKYRQQRRPYLSAIQDLAARMQSGMPIEVASRDFLALPGAIRCYVLDGVGMQTGPAVISPTAPAPQGVDFQAFCRNGLANWSRRDFFRRAVKDAGIAQVTRQYCSLLGYPHCVTFSIVVPVAGKPAVICGDVDWTAQAE